MNNTSHACCMFRLTRDALYNLHELSYDFDFVHHITTFPDLSIILYDPALMSTFKSLLSTSYTDLPTQQLTYDTTFNLGDFFLSVLLFRNTNFDEQPVIPLAYLIHERKLTSTHTQFFAHMKTVCPEIGTAKNVVIITDQELSIRQGIRAAYPDVRLFLCWNHVLQVCNISINDKC